MKDLVSFVRRLSLVLFLMTFASAIVSANFTVTLFIDNNLNGLKEPTESMVTGATVQAYCSDGNTVSAIDNGDGTYTVATTAPSCRVEVNASSLGLGSANNHVGGTGVMPTVFVATGANTGGIISYRSLLLYRIANPIPKWL